MPEICRFYGIIIKMFFADHHPPHFHALYGEHEAIIEIGSLGLFAGGLPPRALGLVMEWAAIHQNELATLWESAIKLEPIGQIEPLQ